MQAQRRMVAAVVGKDERARTQGRVRLDGSGPWALKNPSPAH